MTTGFFSGCIFCLSRKGGTANRIMAIPVKLPVFEGPLDLLLHLIEKNKIDIYDIPIVVITDQYLEYIHQMDHEDMDVTSEFLVMAATLLDIKSRMLLPREKDEVTGEEEADPREELVRRLLEYKMYKYMSEELAVCRDQAGVRYFRAQNLPKEVRSYQPPIDYDDLLKGTDLKSLENVFHEVLRRKKSRRDPIRSGFGKIRREEVNIDTKTLYVRAYLMAHPRTDFRALLESQESKEEVIVTFLILLELMKVQKVHIVQDSICGKILIEADTAAMSSPEAQVNDEEPAADETVLKTEIKAIDIQEVDVREVDAQTIDVKKVDIRKDLLSEEKNRKLSSAIACTSKPLTFSRIKEISSLFSVPAQVPAEISATKETVVATLVAQASAETSPAKKAVTAETIQVPAETPATEENVETDAAEEFPESSDDTVFALPMQQHFSDFLWHGSLPKYAAPDSHFRGMYGVNSCSGSQTAFRHTLRKASLWEQTRLSRLWARRL